MASPFIRVNGQVSPPVSASASASAARSLAASSASSSELARALLSRIQVLEEQVMKTSDKLMQGMVSRDISNHFSECQSTLTDAVVRTQWKCAMASAAFLSLLAMLSAYFTKA